MTPSFIIFLITAVGAFIEPPMFDSARQSKKCITPIIKTSTSEGETPLPLCDTGSKKNSKPADLSPLDFRKIVTSKITFIIDKSEWIERAVSGAQLQLINRPRKFGKSFNLSMLYYFLENGTHVHENLFENLKINGAEYPHIREKHQYKYTAIFLDFFGLKLGSLDEIIGFLKNKLRLQLNKLLLKHRVVFLKDGSYEDVLFYTKRSNIASNDAIIITKILIEGFGPALVSLNRHHIKYAILVDEYDAPIQGAFENDQSPDKKLGKWNPSGLFRQVRMLMRSVYLFFFADSEFIPRLEIMIGIDQLDRGGIFSDTYNFQEHSVINAFKFETDFGLTQSESAQLLKDTKSGIRIEDLKSWYYGYDIGSYTIYNVFLVVNAVQRNTLGLYWANSRSQTFLRQIFKHAGPYILHQINFLLRNITLERRIYSDMIYEEMYVREEALWRLLVQTGYLNAEYSKEDGFITKYGLRIPNFEIRTFLHELLCDELRTLKVKYNKFVRYFMNVNETENKQKFEESINELVKTSKPYANLECKSTTVFGTFLADLIDGVPGYKIISREGIDSGRIGWFQFIMFPNDKKASIRLIIVVGPNNIEDHFQKIQQMISGLEIPSKTAEGKGNPNGKKTNATESYSNAYSIVVRFSKQVGHDILVKVASTAIVNNLSFIQDVLHKITHSTG